MKQKEMAKWENLNKLTGKGAEKSKEHPELKVNGILIKDSKFISTTFNNFFVDSVRELAQRFSTKTTVLTPIDNNNTPLFTIPEISLSAVDSIISFSGSSRTEYVFGLNTVFLKRHKYSLFATIVH